MPHGCWIDLYDLPNCTGERRRFFGPARLDAFVWRQFAADDRICVCAGPQAVVRIDATDGGGWLVQPGERSTDLMIDRIAALAIEPIAEPRGAVQRTTDDPPPTPIQPRPNRARDAQDDAVADPSTP